MSQQVTILIPNYRTPDLTRLCLRLLRKHTDPSLAKVIVIDNHSGDESVQYLRSLQWIELLERQPAAEESPAMAHAKALDLALERVSTPYVLSIHTDTFVVHPRWLRFLLKQFEDNPRIAGVGSWKLEIKPVWHRALRAVEHRVRPALRRLGLSRRPPEEQYLRSYCAIYRTTLLNEHLLRFSMGNATAGSEMHRQLVSRGYEMKFLPAEQLMKYVWHLNHATMVLNPELGARRRTIDTGLKRIRRYLDAINADRLLQDSSLDA